MSTSTVSIAVQVDGVAKAITDLGAVDRAVKEVGRGTSDLGKTGPDVALVGGALVRLGEQANTGAKAVDAVGKSVTNLGKTGPDVALVGGELVRLGEQANTGAKAVDAVGKSADKAAAAGKRLGSGRVWDSYRQGASEAKSSTEALAKSLGTVRAAANASGLKSHNAEIERMARLCGLSTSSITNMVRQMDAARRTQAFEGLRQSANLSTIQLAKLQAEMGDMRGAFGTLVDGAGRAKLAIAALGAVLLLAGKSCLDAATRADRLSKAYTTITGSAAGAEAQLAYIYETTNRLGLQFQGTAEAAKSFFAAGKDSSLAPEMNRIFEAVNTAGAALSMSTDEIHSAFLALGQMISKGKVQAEELRGQLGERLPGAFQLAAKAMNMTTAQLDKFMADGKLTAEVLLPKLATVMQQTFEAGAAAAANGLVGQINRLSTEWERFKAALVDSDAAAKVFGAMATAMRVLADNGAAVSAVIMAISEWAAVTAVIYGIVKALEAMKAAIAAVNIAGFLAGATTLTAALGGPLGVAVAVGAVVTGLTLLCKSTASADDIFKRHQGTIDAYREKMGLAAKSVDELGKKQDEASRKSLERMQYILKADIHAVLEDINSGFSGIGSTSMGNFGMDSPSRALGGLREEVERLGNGLAALGDKLTQQDLDEYVAKVKAVDERAIAAGIATKAWNDAMDAHIYSSDSFIAKLMAMAAQGKTLAEALDEMRRAGAEAKAELATGWSLNVDDATKGVAAIMGQIRGMEAEMAGLKSSKVLVNLFPEISVEQIAKMRAAYGKEGLAGALEVAGEASKAWSVTQVDAFAEVLKATEQLDATAAKHKVFTDGQRKSSKGVADQSEITATKLDQLRQEVEALEAANIPAAKGFDQIAAKLELERKNAIAAAEANEKLALQRKKASPAQAAEQRRLETLKAELTYTQKIAEAESQNADIRLDFEKRYADMVGATSQGVIDSIKKQSAEYASAGADRVRLAEWERDQVQRASSDAWDGAAVALRDYSAEAGNQAKGMGQAFGDLFNGLDSGFKSVWNEILEDGKVSLSSFRSLFANFLAELMHMAVTRPITVSIAGVVSGGLFGGTGTANAGGTASGSGGFSLPGASSLTSFLPDSLTSGVSNFMSTPLPGSFGFVTNGATPLSMASGLSVGSALGYGAAGGLGYSLLGGALGLPQNKYTGITSGLGGTLGAWGGSALGTALGTSGAISGAMAGSVAFPIVGTILGALGGGLLGGLFGTERKTRPSVYTRADDLKIDSDYDYTAAFQQGAWYDRAGKEEADKVMPVLGEAAKVAAAQVEALVAALPEEFRGQVEKEIGNATFAAGRGVAGMDKSNWNFQFYDEEQLKARLEAVVKDIQLAMGRVAQEAMDGIDMSSMYTFDLGTSEGMDRAVKAVTSVKEITEATKAIAEPASQLVEQAKAAKTQMEEWTASMKEYGVVGDYAKELVDEYRQASIDSYIKSLEESIDPTSQYEQAVKAANKSVDDHMAALKEMGATEEEVARVEKMRADVLEATAGALLADFDQSMRIRELQLSGSAELLTSTQFAIQQEAELAEVRAKFGESSSQYAQAVDMQTRELAAATRELAAARLQFQAEYSIRVSEAGGQDTTLARLTMQQESEIQQIIAKFGQNSKEYYDMLTLHRLEYEKAMEQAAQNSTAAAESSGRAWQSAVDQVKQAEQAILQYTYDMVDQLQQKMRDVLKAYVDQATTIYDKAQDAFTQGLKRDMDKLSSSIDGFGQAVDSLRSAQKDIWQQNATPSQSYASLTAEMQALYAKAAGGDVDAAGELASLTSKWLDASYQSQSDFAGYEKDRLEANKMLGSLAGILDGQKSEAQKQLDALTKARQRAGVDWAATEGGQPRSASAAIATPIASESEFRTGRADERDLIDDMVDAELEGWERVVTPMVTPIQRLAAECADEQEFLDRLPEILSEQDVTALARNLAESAFAARVLAEQGDENGN